MRQSAIQYVHKYRSELLLFALVVQIMISPLADFHPLIGAVLAVIVLLLVFAGATYMTNKRLPLFVVIPAAVIWLVARALEAFGNSHHPFTHLAPVAGLVLSCAVLWALLQRFSSQHIVTRNLIAEAFINYLVIAIAFSQLYWIFNHFLRQPFSHPVPRNQTSDLLYFSMVTLSNLGYSTLAPINPYLQFVTALESMLGIFYIAVVVARIVSSYRPRQRRADRMPG